MKSLDSIVESLTPLVKSYARDMSLLIVEDQTSNIEFYKARFGKFFRVCDIALNGQEALELWSKDHEYYDLIVTDVHMPIMSGLEFIQCIRKDSMDQSIIVITSTTDLDENQDLAYYYIDGLLPKPVENKRLFILLYRVLKKISEKKELGYYISDLEKQVDEAAELKNNFNFIIDKLKPISKQKEAHDVIAMLNTLVGRTDVIIEEKCSKIVSYDDHEKDLRFSTADNKLSSADFMKQLDDTIVDKIEDFLVVLDKFVNELDKMETQNPEDAMVSLHKVSTYFEDFIGIVSSLVVFPIIVRAFINLKNFLDNIEEQSLANNDRKLFLISLLLNIEKDVANWINTIFIDNTAENIYYFDASFSNGAFEIESMFNSFDQVSDEEFDDDDLGFF